MLSHQSISNAGIWVRENPAAAHESQPGRRFAIEVDGGVRVRLQNRGWGDRRDVVVDAGLDRRRLARIGTTQMISRDFRICRTDIEMAWAPAMPSASVRTALA
jgi:hypothetical protein